MPSPESPQNRMTACSIVSFFFGGTCVLVAMDLENLPQTGATSNYTAAGLDPQPAAPERDRVASQMTAAEGLRRL